MAAGRLQRQEIKAFRDAAYERGDLVGACVAEMAMDRWASAQDVIRKMDERERAEALEAFGARSFGDGGPVGVEAATLLVGRWVDGMRTIRICTGCGAKVSRGQSHSGGCREAAKPESQRESRFADRGEV